MENIESSNQLDLKEKAALSISKAQETILEHIPRDQIVSIYVKGSYVQDELQPDSDVDLVVILKGEEYLPAIYELTEKYGNTTHPPFQIIAYTLDELRTGIWSTHRPKKATTISVFVKQIDQFLLLYGSKPEGKLHTRTDVKDLTALVSFFEESFLSDFESGKVQFRGLVKIVLWLVEREQRALGLVPEYSWQKLADSIHDENHIVHLALKLRRQKEVSKEEQDNFVKRLKEYLAFLKDTYQNSTK